MRDFVKTKQIADALQTSRRQILERSKMEGWPCVEKSGGLQFVENRLPLDVRFALSKVSQARPPGQSERDEKPHEEAEIAGHAFVQASDKARDKAIWKSSFLWEYKESGLTPQDFCEHYNAGLIKPALLAKLGSVSVRSLYRWLGDQKDAKARGMPVMGALVPRHGLVPGGAGASLSPAEKALLRSFWLRDSQPTMIHAWQQMLRKYPGSLCTQRTASRYLQSIPPVERDYFRLGKTRFENLHLPYVERDIFRYKSLDVVVSDHHCVDCVVMYRGKLVRPWITTFQDYRSGKILGWCPSVKPSSLSIIVAYYMCCINYGIPKEVLFDNGKDYRSKLLNGYSTKAKAQTPEGVTEEVEIFFQGVLPLIGSDVHFTRTYSGKSKGRQERYFRILGEYLAKDIGSYVGSDSRTRPEDAALIWRSINGMAQREDIPDWDFFVKASGAMMEYINDTFKSDGKGMDGKTRSQVFEENLPDVIRRASKEQLQQALCRSEVRKCSRNVIKIRGVLYGHDDLAMFSGQDVVIKNSLLSDTELPVYSLSGAYICTAQANYYLEGKDVSESIAKVERAKKRTLLQLAEQGTNELSLSADEKVMIETATLAYNDKLASIDLLFGGEESSSDSPDERQEEVKQAVSSKYKSQLDATPEDYYMMEA